MILNWQRVNDIYELNIGDIIRSNPESIRLQQPSILINKIECDYNYKFCNIIFYNTHVIIENNKFIYKDITYIYKLYLDNKLLYDNEISNSWTEKLIIENNYKDEIDILMDCILR